MRFTRPATAAALAAVMLLAACGSQSEPDAAPDTNNAHTTHSGSAPPPTPLRDGERFVDVGLSTPYTPKAPNGGTDEYRCFLVDPKLTKQAFLTGSSFKPQNAALVHHAIFYRLDPAQAGEAAKVDAKSEGEGWTCFGDSGVQGQTAWVAHWAPGAGETLMPAGFGFTMPPGSKLVMQVHYNLLGAGDGAAGSDASGMQMRLSDSAALKPLETGLVMAPVELPCEPGGSGPLCDRTAAVADVKKRFGAPSEEQVNQLNAWCNNGGAPKPGTTQSCDQPIDQGGTVYMAAGHMHLLGRAIKMELNPGTASAQTLLDVPQYSFDEQALTPLATPVKITKGDNVRVTCTHDATLRKQLPQLKQLPSRYVVWGEGTSDEMCLGILVVAPE
ncbi:monooxygenase [Actinoplanes couchii]|uniref:Copper type II ascorbate-dependent monooxygenase C-terminal domain-containing protein n=1 Tax=Actinoplanes couchii TaxID=403638 RepID=A0ABQ3X7B6_9ACTN|nr:monooxygenase [Actinoplanes couchii]MDR6322215.1 hypothetical protein [Actinoplanes couchii]GID54377.1 hypothetical protein Aco03nite_027810 [Actinoplanes couchii]